MREAYVRLDLTHHGVNVIPGLEWRDTDSLPVLCRALKGVVQGALTATEPQDIAKEVEAAIRTAFPGRRYFLEVESGDGSWVQLWENQR